MSKRLFLERKSYTESEAAKVLFPRVLAARFWWGVFFGVFLMAAADLTDLHICVGECDGQGVNIKDAFSALDQQ